MPMDIRVLDTIISIIKNGIYKKKPISKAVFSSLIINAGISAEVGISLLAKGLFTCPSFKNNARSFSLVYLNIKLRIGTEAFLIASSCEISLFVYGLKAVSFISDITGDITKNVRNKARPIST